MQPIFVLLITNHKRAKYMKKFILVFCLFSLATKLHAQQTDSLINLQVSKAYSQQIESASKLIAPLLEIYPGLQISVAKGNEVLWAESFGLANVNSNLPMRPDHRLQLYSLSKPVTAMIIAKLMEEKLIDPDASVTEYIKDLPVAYKNVLIKHLLYHTAGIRHYKKGEWMKWSNTHCDDLMSGVSQFISDDLISTPGDQYTYSLFGYLLLSLVAEKVSGVSFAELVTRLTKSSTSYNNITDSRYGG